MPVFNRNRHSGSSGVAAAAYTIDQSCRFNDGDSAAMSFTPGEDGDSLKIITISLWVKRCTLGTKQIIYGAGAGVDMLFFDATNHLALQMAGIDRRITTRVFRDVGAWYHIVAAHDTTQGTAADRHSLYVNGVKETAFDTTSNIAQDTDLGSLNSNAVVQYFGRQSGGIQFLDAYVAEFAFIDGTAYAASDFGETDNGNWIPKDISALTFGTNGVWLDFAVASGTSNGAGTDVSGEGNHYTDINLAANDQTTDSPTDDADNDVGNYCTFNPLDKESALALSDGNLTAVGSSYDYGRCTQSCFDKCYFEAKMITTSYAGDGGGARNQCGVATLQWNIYTTSLETSTYGWATDQALTPFDSGTTLSGPGGSWDAGESICWALETNGADVDIWFRVNAGTWVGGGDPAASSTPTMTADDTAIEDLFPAVGLYSSGDKQTFNFGASGFDYTPPSGFKALHTGNRPAPTITDPSKFFQVDTFTGTGSELVRTLTDGAGGAVKPDILHIKDRDTATTQTFTDSARGATKEIALDVYGAQSTVAQGVKSFNASGYTLGTDTDYNASSSPNVAYAWVTQGGAGSSNENGSINTITTSVGTTQGVSIGTYTGTGSAATVGHGLGAVPEFYAVKRTDAGNEEFWVYHHKNTAAPETDKLHFGENTATVDDATVWNDTAPTSTVFSVGTHTGTNGSSSVYVAWCMVGIEGFSKFGSYEGNGNADGTFVWCGFRPAYIWCKSIDSTSNWFLYDHKRDGYNVDNDAFFINTTAAEATADNIDILSNGFKLRIATDPNVAETNIFAAFAEFPFGGVDVSQARAR